MTENLPEVPESASPGDRLKAAILAKGFPSTKAFSKDAGLPYESLNSVVSGKRNLSPSKAESYANLLGVPVSWLFGKDTLATNGHATEIDTRVQVLHICSPKWTSRPERIPVHVPTLVEFPLTVRRVQRADLFAAFCDDPVGPSLQRGSYVICAKMAALKAGAPKIGFLVRETNAKFHRILPWFHIGRDGEHVNPAEPDDVVRLEPVAPDGVELIGLIVAAWTIAI